MSERTRVGLVLGNVDGVVEEAQQAERLGFDLVGVGEHVAFHGETNNAFIALAAISSRTDSIRLMSTVTLLPLYTAGVAAKQIAVLDVLSAGRLTVGIGVGGEFPGEFEACGVPVAERGRRTDEALRAIDVLLTSRGATHSGTFLSFKDISIDPPAVQTPRPPFVIAGRKAPAIRRAARYGEGWMPYMYTPAQLEAGLRDIADIRERENLRANPIDAGIFIFAHVADDSAQAHARAAEYVGDVYRQDFRRLTHKYVLAGTPEECRERVAEYKEAGASFFMVNPVGPARERKENAEWLLREVFEPNDEEES